MKAFVYYLRYVLLHKYHVFVFGRKLKVPFWQLVFHDWTKFLPDEFIPYMRTFGNGSLVGDNKEYFKSEEFLTAWNLHQKRNKHHWQWWIVNNHMGNQVALKMPDNHLLEMIADWYGAGAVKGIKSPLEFYTKNAADMKFDIETRERLEVLLYQYF